MLINLGAYFFEKNYKVAQTITLLITLYISAKTYKLWRVDLYKTSIIMSQCR